MGVSNDGLCLVGCTMSTSGFDLRLGQASLSVSCYHVVCRRLTHSHCGDDVVLHTRDEQAEVQAGRHGLNPGHVIATTITSLDREIADVAFVFGISP